MPIRIDSEILGQNVLPHADDLRPGEFLSGGEAVIVSVEGEDALIESVDEAAPGRFPFHCKLSRLVPAES